MPVFLLFTKKKKNAHEIFCEHYTGSQETSLGTILHSVICSILFLLYLYLSECVTLNI